MGEVSGGVKGYKVFNPDWTCKGKQYSCPGKFEEDVKIFICERGMHFCKKAVDCFNYYDFNPDFHVAEVVAYGQVVELDDKCVTDKLEIVREVPWNEVLEMVNVGKACTGYRNTGDCNTGNCNTGNCNTGNRNTGYRNTGDWNTGYCNTGNCNTGYRNTGDCNTGYRNTGNCNTGNRNTGYRNTGDWNTGYCNTGNCNTGHRNTGDCNTGYRNTGDWNTCSHSSGCFNTVEQTIPLFNKPSDWTYDMWRSSSAHKIMLTMPRPRLEWRNLVNMSDDENKEHPEAKVTGGYLAKITVGADELNQWWQSLPINSKEEVLSLPNFDKAIFKEITGINVDAERVDD